MAREVERDDAGGNGADDGQPAANGDGLQVDGLTPKQEQGMIALLNHPTIKSAAAARGFAERTLHAWLDQPGFARAYRRARRRAFSHAVALAQHYAAASVHTLVKVQQDTAAGAAARVSAAGAILKFGRESIELDDLTERLEALEQTAQRAADADRQQGGFGSDPGFRVRRTP